ncbi:MAG: hypothetical protein JWQ10_2385 [Herbaspirillum sp.]|jgi:hypothetical protein|nr:hypothetical protein [Herbaspirillum sp.]
MNYKDVIVKATKGRSVNSLAKAWGVPQKTMESYIKGFTLPDPCTAIILADEAGIGHGKMLEILAQEYKMKKATRPRGSAAFQNKSSLVARGGIEPPTQGFSILCSTD